jgi:excisionase family DNA binding protein
MARKPCFCRAFVVVADGARRLFAAGCKQICKQQVAGPRVGARRWWAMDDVSIPLPAGILDLLVERTAARLHATVVVSEPWVGIDAAAAHLACKRQRIYDLVSRRTIPHRKEGSRLLFKLSHLDAWIEGGGAA